MGLFNTGGKRSRKEGGKTIIAQGCKLSGEITELDGSLHIDGKIEGIIESDFDVSIGKTGCVIGLLKAKRIVLSGILDGKIGCETIEVLSTGRLTGDLICSKLTIEAGGKFVGRSHEVSEDGIAATQSKIFEQMANKEVIDHFISSEHVTNNTLDNMSEEVEDEEVVGDEAEQAISSQK